MNNITIFGRLSKDVEIKQLQDNKSVPNFSVACNGRKKEDVSFFDCKAFNGTADTISKYFVKGDQIVLYGQMHQYTFNKQDGTKFTGWEVLVDSIDFVASGEKKERKDTPTPVDNIPVGELPF